MSKKSQLVLVLEKLDDEIDGVRKKADYDIAVLEAAKARLLAQRDAQSAKKAATS